MVRPERSRTAGERVAYGRNAILEEWYVDDARRPRWSDGTATAERYGARNGITVFRETCAADGQSFVRFPSSVEGP